MSEQIIVEWNCHHCEAVFNTRDKRDAHYKRKHQEFSVDKSTQRNTDEKFVCHCSKEFWTMNGLNTHKKKCVIDEFISSESEDVYLLMFH